MFMESSTAHTPGGANKRKKQAELEEKINALYSNIKLFEKSIKVIHGKLILSKLSMINIFCHYALGP